MSMTKRVAGTADPKVAPRRMEQAIFRTIVEMAWEMGLAEEKQDAFLISKAHIREFIEGLPSEKNNYDYQSGRDRLAIYSDGRRHHFKKGILNSASEAKYNIISPMPTSPFYTLCYCKTIQYLPYNPENRLGVYEKLCNMAIEMVKTGLQKKEHDEPDIESVIRVNYVLARNRMSRWEEMRKRILNGDDTLPSMAWIVELYKSAYRTWMSYENFFHQPKILR